MARSYCGGFYYRGYFRAYYRAYIDEACLNKAYINKVYNYLLLGFS